MNEHFRIRVIGAKPVAAAKQFLTQLSVVINLAVKHHPHGLVFVGQGLAGGDIQIDDREPLMPEKHIWLLLGMQLVKRRSWIVNRVSPAVGQSRNQSAIAIRSTMPQRGEPVVTALQR